MLNNNSSSFEYRMLEWKLILNKKLYENKVIDSNVFSLMEKSLINRLKKYNVI